MSDQRIPNEEVPRLMEWLKRREDEVIGPDWLRARRGEVEKEAALEYVRDHLLGASNYSEAARSMALRYVSWALRPKPEGATLTECGNGHKIWRVWKHGDSCPVCVGWEET